MQSEKPLYTIKSKPQDFVVEEIPLVKPLDDGMYLYFWLTKHNYALFRALEHLARAWHVSLSSFGYAGIKDKYAVTTQLCSVKGITRDVIEKTSLPDLTLRYYGRGNEPVTLGNLVGNQFTVVVRDFEKKPHWKNPFVNTYGEQRFSSANTLVGKLFVQKKYAEAVAELQKTQKDHLGPLLSHLEEHPSDYVTALRRLDPKFLMIFVHAYQSHLWNTAVHLYLKKNPEPDLAKTFPVFGFGTEIKDKTIQALYDALLREEGITERDFINTSIKTFCVYGDERNIWIEAKEFTEEKVSDGVKVTFMLPKGAYATEFIGQAFL